MVASATATAASLRSLRDNVSNLLAEGVENDRLKEALDAFVSNVNLGDEIAVRELDTLVRQLTQYDIPESIRPSLLGLQNTLSAKIQASKSPRSILVTSLSDVMSLRNTYDVMAGADSPKAEVEAMQAASKCLGSLIAAGTVPKADRAQTQLVWSALTLLARPDVKQDEALASSILGLLAENRAVFDTAGNKSAPPEFYRGALVRGSDQRLLWSAQDIFKKLSPIHNSPLYLKAEALYASLFQSPAREDCRRQVSDLDPRYHAPPRRSSGGKGY